MNHNIQYISFHYVLFFLFSFTCNIAFSADGKIQINETNGLPEVSLGGEKIIKATYVYFGVEDSGKWTWAGQKNNFKTLANYQYLNKGENKEFGYVFDSLSSKKNENSIDFSINFDLKKNLPKIIGGGIEFKLNPAFNKAYKKPQLLSDNKGWIWGDPKGKHFKFEFDNPLPNVFFERNNPNIIRAYFFKDSIKKSKQSYRAILTSPTNFKIEQSISEKFGNKDKHNWVDLDDPFYSPLDLSYLNESPTGKHGFLKAKGDKLVFEDGTSAKFWGTNISAYALFYTSQLDIPKHAERIAKLGFNLVRIHHHDSYWVKPNVFGSNATSTRHLNEEYLYTIDKWIAELNKRGVYIWFDLHVQRFVTANDNIYAFDEIEKKTPNQKGKAEIKGYSYFNNTIRDTMKEINRQFLTRTNKFTKQKYADNSGIAFLLLTNENDITHHFGNMLLPPQEVPKHTELYLSKAKAFSEDHNLPYNKVWTSWLAGPSKLFLNEMEHRFNNDLILNLRKYDINHLIATTNIWGNNPMFSLPALTEGDLIDVHSYGHAGLLEKDPTVSPNFIHKIAAAQVVNKPISVTEWNIEKYPAPDRHVSPLYIGAVASHQGWDALMQFGYTAEPPKAKGKAFNYAMYNDPSFLGVMPAAALMYRANHLKEAEKTFIFTPTKEQLLYSDITPKTSKAIRTIPEQSKLVVAMPKVSELPWLKPSAIPQDTININDPNFSLLAKNSTQIKSDTGELIRDWQKGIYTIDSPKTKAATGWIGGESIKLKGIKFNITTKNASVVVQSLDKEPLENSENIFISLAARSESKTKYQAPIFAEPVTGNIYIKARPGLKLYKKKHISTFIEVPSSYTDGVYAIPLTNQLKTYWLFLTNSKS